MSTHSLIGLENADGSIIYIYCHYDGYLDGVGVTLLTKWCSRLSATALMSLGDLSSLGDDLLTTVAYTRDRGEHGTDASTILNRRDILECASRCGAQYCYLMDQNDDWLISTNRGSTFASLESAVKHKMSSK